VIGRAFLLALLLATGVAAAESAEVSCFDRDNLELRYELFVHSIDGTPPKTRPPIFSHNVPGRSIRKIETGTLPAGNEGAGRRVPIVRVWLGPADLAKIRELETKAEKYATDAAGAHAALSSTAHGQLLAWGRPTGLDALLLPSRGDGEPLLQIPPILERDLGKWVRWELRCPADPIPANVSESIERLLKKSDSFDITPDLHVLMGFEAPEMGDSENVTDGSTNTLYYFRRLGITWGIFTDPNGKTRNVFGRGRQ
jgi:hypothetical protein